MFTMPWFRLTFVVLAAALLFVGCDRTDPQALVARAEQALLNKDYRAAVLDLKSVLQKEPENTRARWLLAETYLAVEDGASAQKELEWTRARGVEDDAAVPLLAQALWLQNQFDAVLALPKDGVRSPASLADLGAFRALARIGQGMLEEARVELEPALAGGAATRYARFAEARLAAAEGARDNALAMVEQLTNDEPSYADAWSLRGDLLGAARDYAGAESAYTKAMENRRGALKDRAKRGFARVALENWEGAAEDAAALQKAAPNFQLGHYLAGLTAIRKDDFERAREALERAYQLAPRHLQSVFLLAAVEARQGNENRARQLAEQAVALQPGFIPARKLLATWHLRDRKGREAEDMVRPIVQAKPDDMQAKNMLAAALIAQGKGEEAAVLLQAIAEQQPDSPLAQLRAGLGLLSSGDVDAGVAALERAAASTPDDPNLNTALVAGLLQQRETETALARAQDYLERNPDSPAAMNLVAAAQLAAGDRAAAKAAYEHTLANDPGNLKALQMLATLALSEKANGEALARTREGLEAHADDLQLLLLQAAAARAAGNTDLNRSTLQHAVEAHPEQLGPKALLARQLLDDGQAEQALALLSRVNAGTHSGVLAARAEAYYRLSRLDEAKRDLEALAALLPDSVELQAQLARTYEALDDRAGLERTLNRMLALAPTDPRVALAKARFAIVSGRPAEARALLDAEILAGREDLSVLTTRVALARAEGDRAAEVTYARQLFTAQPSSLHAVMLSRALQRSGAADESKQGLSGWLADHPRDVGVLAELANLHIGRGDVDASVSYLRQIVAIDPNNLYALNNLAWYLRQISIIEARSFAEQAIALAPNEPTIVDTYAAVLAEARDYASALRALDQAIDRGRDVDALRLRRAETLHQSGEQTAAINELKRVLDAAPPPAVKTRAEKLLAEYAGSGT